MKKIICPLIVCLMLFASCQKNEVTFNPANCMLTFSHGKFGIETVIVDQEDRIQIYTLMTKGLVKAFNLCNPDTSVFETTLFKREFDKNMGMVIAIRAEDGNGGSKVWTFEIDKKDWENKRIIRGIRFRI